MNTNRLVIIIVITVVSFIGLLILIPIITIMIANPEAQRAKSNDAVRSKDIEVISDSIELYIIDNKGELPDTISSLQKEKVYQLGTCMNGGDILCEGAGSKCLNLIPEISSYVSRMPIEYSGGTEETTGYSVKLTRNNEIVINACLAANDPISATVIVK